MSASLPLALDQVQWHDGVLVDIALSGFADEAQRFTLVVDLYADGDDVRRRYTCVSNGLSRFSLSGYIDLLLANRRPGNIDHMHLKREADTEILILHLFGGLIEVQARSFQITESPQ